MTNKLQTTNQNAIITLNKTKNLLNIANDLILKKNTNSITEIFKFKPYFSTGHMGYVQSIAISPNGKTALTASWDCTVKLWDIEKGDVIRTYLGHEDQVNAVDISPDGKTAISGDKNGILKLWDISSGDTIRSFGGNSPNVNSVAFSPNGKYVLSGSGFFKDDKNNLKVWDVTSGEIIQNFENHTGLVKSVAFLLDGNTIISATDTNKIEQWDIISGEVIRRFNQNYSFNNPIAISPDGKMIAYEDGLWDTTLKICNLENGKELLSIKVHSASIQSISFSPDSKTVITSAGNFDNTQKLWDIETGKKILTFSTYDNSAIVNFNPNGKSALLGDIHDGSIKLLDISNGSVINIFDYQIRDSSRNINFENDRTSIVSSCCNEFLEFCNILHYERYPRDLICTNQDNENILYIFLGANIIISNAQREIIQELKGNQVSWFESFAISIDNRFAISGGDDSILRLWDIKTGHELQIFRGHKDSIREVSMTTDSNYLLSYSDDQTFKFWDIKSGNCLFTTFKREKLDPFEDYIYMSITPDGYFNAEKEGIESFLRINDGPMSCRKLTEVEIKYFRKKNLMDLNKE